jgi:DNA-binding cell septation regulator SpoVG
MIVTRVRLRLFPDPQSRIKAVGCLVLDECFQIEHVHVVENEQGKLIVAMPTQYESGVYHDVAHPITGAFRFEMNRAVLSEYRRLLTKSTDSVIIRP